MSPARRRHRRRSQSTQPGESADSSSFIGAGSPHDLSPAQRYAAFLNEQRATQSVRYQWTQTLSFTPDAFQIQAMDAVERGECVLVAAPTGAGKTVIGEFATHLALAHGKRCFYTTPIKALSNQKYLDFSRRFGSDNVGLLTGDTSINAGAPIIVMTTEVLRNMIYAGADLRELESVVLDEVHYLADRFRGPVWEEVIIHLPRRISIVALSATVSNAEEFGAWIREVRGTCDIVVSETRPVPLYQHMMVGDEIFDVYAPSQRSSSVRASHGSSVALAKLNPELIAATSQPRSRVGRGSRNWSQEQQVARPRESRPSTLITLDRAHLLPAITFVFSRAGCEDAVRQILAARIVLTTREEADQIRRYAEEATLAVSAEDHAVLGLDRWIRGLERGVAAHHAGLLPIMKETVEQLFARGLVKMVYATETLALGINMPARTVVIESLRKWNGAEHVQLTPGEYTQLSGRAGRRGIDTEGHSVVLHQGRVAPQEVAALASKRTYPLVSAFHPTYNMVVNLLEHLTRAQTRDLLETSFAQYQADGTVVRLAQHARALEERERELAAKIHCDHGDAREYFELRDRLSRVQKESAKTRIANAREEARSVLVNARPGDILAYGRGRRITYAVFAYMAETASGRRIPQVIGTDGKWHALDSRDAPGGMQVVGHMTIAGGSALRRHKERIRIGDELRHRVRSGTLDTPRRRSDGQLNDRGSGGEDEEATLQTAIRHHGVHRCPERESHARAGHQWARVHREREKVLEQVNNYTHTIAQEFDRVCQVLEELEFLSGETVTDKGQQLRRVFGERDLITMEAVTSGAWDELSPAELAAVVSGCVYESRADETMPLTLPPGVGPAIDDAWERTLEAMERVHAAEERVGSDLTPSVDAGLVGATLAWAHGSSLSTALASSDIQGGDFVRWIRQVMDALDQLRHIDRPALTDTARQARQLLIHGVVSWSHL
ncbi:DEAD/DEAH box helicase [Schaalia sp. ZJ1691]|uniref:DEAD/DEAH box helicase n=1 Tax=Schaalia sp. ZJ1691 TaxID=2709404 RepID=UPI0013EB6BA2|nr:DEAD/DEAH box helicase [Schaalia sp. ZJ1691]